MSDDLDPLLKRLHLANARRVWRDMAVRARRFRSNLMRSTASGRIERHVETSGAN